MYLDSFSVSLSKAQTELKNKLLEKNYYNFDQFDLKQVERNVHFQISEDVKLLSKES